MRGMISTHFRKPHRPSDRELRYMDLYASEAVELIERKWTEKALRAGEQRFRRYFELGLIGMALTSPTKDMLEVNDELCRILGYEREELLQKTWPEMTHPDDLAANVTQFQRVLAGEIDGYSLDKRWIRKDGRVVHSIMAARCGRRADGSVDYFVGLVQDITERKLAEERLAEARSDLARMMRVTTMGELAASIAHEVSQPLAAIVSNAHAGIRWLAGKAPDPQEATGALERIVRDANRASAVIDRIRTFLKRQTTPKVDSDVREVIAEVLPLLQGQLRTTGVSVVREQPDFQPLVYGDRVQLQQVVLNLMMNAIDAMRSVSDRARVVKIGISKQGQTCCASRCVIPVSDCIRRSVSAFSRLSTRVSLMGWAWGSRSAGPSWSPTADDCGPRLTQDPESRFSSSGRYHLRLFYDDAAERAS